MKISYGEKMAKYDSFIFDLYGTLVDIRTNESKASLWKRMSELLSYMGFPYDYKSLKKEYAALIDKETDELIAELGVDVSISTRQEFKGAVTKSCPPIMVNGEVRKPEIELRKVFRQLTSPWLTDEEIELLAMTFRTLSTESIRVYDDIIPIFDLLKSRGKKIYLLSNAQACFTIPELRMLGLSDYFDDAFISSDYSCAKPDRRFISMLIKKNKIDISRSIMIGNDYRSDIAIANTVGMDSFYIRTDDSPAVISDADIPATIVDQKSGELRLDHFTSLV